MLVVRDRDPISGMHDPQSIIARAPRGFLPCHSQLPSPRGSQRADFRLKPEATRARACPGCVVRDAGSETRIISDSTHGSPSDPGSRIAHHGPRTTDHGDDPNSPTPLLRRASPIRALSENGRGLVAGGQGLDFETPLVEGQNTSILGRTAGKRGRTTLSCSFWRVPPGGEPHAAGKKADFQQDESARGYV